MSPLVIGSTAYLATGILSLIRSRYKFWFSLLGWFGALAGLIRGSILFRRSGPLISTLGNWKGPGIEFKLDETTLLFAGLVVALNLFTLLYLGSRKEGTFYTLYSFLLASAYSMAFSHDLFNIYVTIEFMSLVSILLIGYEQKGFQIYAGLKYIIFSTLGMNIYLIGLGIVYKAGGHLSISGLARTLGGNPSWGMVWGLRLMVIGLAVKGGIFLFSMWLPDAHSYSMTVVSALLSGMAIKTGLIGIIRLSKLINGNHLWLLLGGLTGLAGAILAVMSRRPKRILAYHTISQVGYVLLGVGVGTSAGILAAGLYVFFHGLFKSLLFLSVGHAGVGSKNLYQIEPDEVPAAARFGVLVGSISIMAIPPFNAYFSKCLLLEQVNREWVWSVMVLIGLGTVLSFLKLNWALTLNRWSLKFDSKDWPLVLFSLAAGLSSLMVVGFLNWKKALHLLSPNHEILSFGIFFAGLLIFLVLKKRLKDIEPPSFFLYLDNSLNFFFTGVLLIASMSIAFFL